MPESENEVDNDSVSVAFNSEDPEDLGVSVDERKRIREELSSMSFEELLKLKEKVGAKAYNETLFGASTSKIKKTDFKRANKNRPREMSSKIRLNKLKTYNLPARKINYRDPRFDPLCGTFDNKTFREDYKFVNDIRMKEKKALEKEYNECNDPVQKKKIKFVIQRLKNQLHEHERLEKSKNKEFEEKREIREKLKQGEKPVFKKKSVKKLENLIEKYEDLKKKNKLQKHIERKSKKLSKKDRKQIKENNT